MEGPERPDSSSSGEQSDSSGLALLYLDADADRLAAIQKHGEPGVEVIGASTVTDAVTVLDAKSVDCLAMGPDGLGDWGPVVENADCPVILYTSTDRADIETRLADASDGFVDRRTEWSDRILVERVRALVSDGTGTGPQTDGLSRFEADAAGTTAIFLVDSDGAVQWTNVPSDDEFLGKSWTEGTAFYDRIAHCADAGSETEQLVRSLARTDESRDWRVVELSTGDDSGQYLHASYPAVDGDGLRFELFRPISSVIDSYQQLERFETFSENAQDGLFVLDPAGVVEYCNRSYAEMLGYEPDEIVGMHVESLLPGDQLEYAQRALEDALKSGASSDIIDIRLENRDGETRETAVHFTVQRGSDDEYEGVLGVIRDITERKQRERELADYQSLVESAGDPMYVVDEFGKIQLVNEAMAEFAGEPRRKLVGLHISDLIPDRAVEEGEIALKIAREREERNYETFETWLTDAEGRERLVEATIGQATDEHGDHSGAVVTLRDITERHKREQELDLIKQIFSRSLRHNIRNKASIIESFATLLADDLTGEHAEMAQAILRASNSLAKTSEKVSDFDWIVDGDSTIVEHDLTEMLREAAAAVRDTNESAAIEFDVDDTVTVEGIRDLQYAFENLVENALEHGVTGGPPTVTIKTAVRADTVCVAVADDGPGIPESEIRVIEEGEETALEHGSGLGLWLVDQVVQQSGGDLEFHIDDGTEARVILPRADVDAAGRSGAEDVARQNSGDGEYAGTDTQTDAGNQ